MLLKLISSNRKLIICGAILFEIFPLFIFAQRNEMLSLESQYKTTPTSQLLSELSKAYQDQADWFRYTPQFNLDSTIFYFDKATVLLENTKPVPFENLAEVYKNKSAFYYHVYKYAEASENASKAWTYFEQMPQAGKQNTILQYEILSNRAFTEVDNKDAKHGLEIFSKAFVLLQDNPDPAIQARVFKDKGYFYSRYNNGIEERTLECLPYLEKSKNLYESFHNSADNAALFTIYDCMSWIYNVVEKYDSCDYYDEKMEKMLPILKDPLLSARFYSLKGNNYYRRQKYKEARQFTEQSRAIAEKYKLEYTTIYTFSTFVMGTIVQKEGNYEEAIKYFEKGRALKVKNNYKDGDLAYLEAMRGLYEQKGDYKKALDFNMQYKDSLLVFLDRSSNDNLRKSELQLNVLRQEKELTQNRIKSNLYLFGFGIALILLGLAGFIYYRERKSRAKLEAKNKIIEEQAQALQQLDAAKTRFFANVSHELRTPLTLIIAPLGTALKSDKLGDKNFSLVALAQQHARKLLNLVNEILDLTKLESGKMMTHEEPTEIYNFLRRLISTFESYAVQKKIKLIFDFNADAPRSLMLDKPKLEKIFNNLLSNALKFTPFDGVITVKVTHHISDWQLSVTDTGRGIHPDDLPHVFNRFYQTNQTTFEIEGGTGIGLALAKELAQVMGGTLSVESILGNGATFMLSLPKKEVLGLAAESDDRQSALDDENALDNWEIASLNAKSETRNPKPEIFQTVLIVEDNPSLRNYLQLILSDKYNVITAENGEKALAILDFKFSSADLTPPENEPNSKLQNRPDLIISDIMMPVMNGFQLIEKLKADARLHAIPLVMLTARAEMQDKLKALRIGVDDYLTKPFEEAELFARIKNLLQNAAVRKQLREEYVLTNADAEKTNESSDKLIGNPEDAEWLESLKNTVHKHIGDYNLSLETVADMMHISRAQFFRRVHILTGLTPRQFLQEIRFNHARQLLEHRSVNSVKAVAAAIGIQKIQYFSEQFKERFGKSPSEYLN